MAADAGQMVNSAAAMQVTCHPNDMGILSVQFFHHGA